MNSRSRVFAGIFALFLGLAPLAAPADGERAIEPLSAFPQGLLSIKTGAGNVHQFTVWIADRETRQEQGLMFVRNLEQHRGMLFVYPGDRQISMWMKNTLISLDMLFIRADGTISYIAARATPQSLDIISAPGYVRAVLELAGGAAEQLGIKSGDKIFSEALDAAPGAAPAR